MWTGITALGNWNPLPLSEFVGETWYGAESWLQRRESCVENWFQHFLAITDKRLVLSTSTEGWFIVYPQVTSFSWLSELRNQTFLGTVLKNSTFRRLPGLAVGTQLIFGDILYLNHLMISPRDPGQLCFLQSTRTHTNLTHTDLEGKKFPHEGTRPSSRS